MVRMNAHRQNLATTRLSRRIQTVGLSAVAVLVLSLGCRSTPRNAASADIAGEYRLESVDGARLPAILNHDGRRLRIESGSLSLHADGTGQSRIAFVAPSGATMVREVSATYRHAGSTVRMKWNGAGRTVATVDGPTLRMSNEGNVFVYSRNPM